MVKLTELYRGAQDSYLEKMNADTYETEFIKTCKKTVRTQFEEYSQEVPQELINANRYFMESPSERMEEFIEVIKKYKHTYFKTIKRQTQSRIELDNRDLSGNLGFTGLRFQGDPMKIKSITFSIGGQRMDKIYPSITGQFDSIDIFNILILRSEFHDVALEVEFIGESQLSVEWDLVRLIEKPRSAEIICVSTSYTGEEHLGEGQNKVQLNFNHPVKELRIYADEPLESIILCLDKKYNFHVPYSCIQNAKYVYKYVFQTPVNFSRIDYADLKVKSSTKNTLHVFAKSINIVRFNSGMAGLAFSK